MSELLPLLFPEVELVPLAVAPALKLVAHLLSVMLLRFQAATVAPE